MQLIWKAEISIFGAFFSSFIGWIKYFFYSSWLRWKYMFWYDLKVCEEILVNIVVVVW